MRSKLLIRLGLFLYDNLGGKTKIPKSSKINFNKKYKKLLDADYWVSVQEKIKENGVMDYYPYGLEMRMCNIYNEK